MSWEKYFTKGIAAVYHLYFYANGVEITQRSRGYGFLVRAKNNLRQKCHRTTQTIENSYFTRLYTICSVFLRFWLFYTIWVK